MNAIHVNADSEHKELSWVEVPAPQLNSNEVLIEVHATALNRADLLQRAGKYPPPAGASEILGLEAAGQVVEVGSAVSGVELGVRVCVLLPGGGYAEYVTAPSAMLLPVPDNLNLLEAAAIPEAFITAFLNLFLEAGLAQGESVLIHGGASGVGTAAIQLAKNVECEVLVTVGSDDKAAYCKKLGANYAVNYKTCDFEERVQQLTDGNGVDVILDIVGASYLEKNLKLLKRYGRLAMIAVLGGVKTEINLLTVISRCLTLRGSVLRSRTVNQKISIVQAFKETFWHKFATGELKPMIDSVYSIRSVEDAHEHMRRNRNAGKIVLQVRNEK